MLEVDEELDEPPELEFVTVVLELLVTVVESSSHDASSSSQSHPQESIVTVVSV